MSERVYLQKVIAYAADFSAALSDLPSDKYVMECGLNVTRVLGKSLDEYGESEFSYFKGGFKHMFDEFSDHHKGASIKISINYDHKGKKNIINVLSTGDKIAESDILKINDRYKKGAEEAKKGTSRDECFERLRFHGSSWAGYFFQKVDAVVQIENISEPGEFNVRNRIELPDK